MKLRLVSTNLKSQSLKELAKGLSTTVGYKVWRGPEPKPNKINLLYGACVDKITQYQYFKFHNINALEFTTEREVARNWANETPVVCRKLTNASEGRGIVIAETPDAVVQAPVYTKYKKKKKEFRVHIFKDKVVHVLEKRRKADFEGDSDHRIRNTANGYVFCSEGVVEPQGIRELALKARRVTKSDFCGVDVGWNEKKNECFIIEVNSAPGIEGSNINRYIETIVNYDY